MKSGQQKNEESTNRDDLPVEFYRQQAAQMQEVATATRHIRPDFVNAPPKLKLVF